MVSKADKREKGIKGNKRVFPFWKEKGKGNNTLRVFPFLLSLYIPKSIFNEKEKGMRSRFFEAEKKREIKGKSLKYQFTACPSAGYLSFPIEPEYRPGRSTDQDHRKNAAKLARFMHEKGVKNSVNSADNNVIMVSDNYANCIYHNHEIQNPYFLHNKRLFQMINDLQRHFESADNFLLVQGCKPKVALLARLAVHQFDHLNLTAGILRGHRVKGRDRQWQ